MGWKHKFKFLLPSIIFIIALYLFGVVDEIVSDKKSEKDIVQINAQTALKKTDEDKYQEGIGLIKQGKWDDAIIQLILLMEQNYKDSKILYYYASAKSELEGEYRDIDMSAHYISNIPDEYDGVLKQDILKFKQEVIQESNNTTEEDKRQRTIEYAREQGLFDLEAVSFRWYISHSYVIAEGQVKNLTTSSLDNVMAVITYRTKDDTFITSDSALIEYTPLLAGQTSPFKVITPYNPEMSTASLEFAEFSGGKLNADYTYNK